MTGGNSQLTIMRKVTILHSYFLRELNFTAKEIDKNDQPTNAPK